MKTKTIAPEVVEILERCTVTGNALVLPETMDRAMYSKVNKVLELLGGKWNKKAKAHLFPTDAEPLISEALLVGEVDDVRKTFDVFYTPPEVAAMVIERADLQPDDYVLEPSAGGGALAVPAAALSHKVVGYEIQADLTWQHEVANVAIFRDDFMAVPADAPGRFGGIVNKVVMNPPFSNARDMAHVRHAFSFLKPGGRLVSVMSPAFQTHQSAVAEEFRDWLANDPAIASASFEDLPSGSFKESGTMVSTVIVTIDKT